jgi:hypothetical protein
MEENRRKIIPVERLKELKEKKKTLWKYLGNPGKLF